MRPIPIGVDDFRKLREQGMEYVDKSRLLLEVLDRGAEVLLLPRPRRFGKTLNLSMLRSFFEKREEDLWGLFEDLEVARAGDRYRAHFQRYPVVFVTLKDIKAPTWEMAWGAIQKKIARLFDEHRDLLGSGCLSAHEEADFQAILDGTAQRATYQNALLDLCRALERHHGQRVVLLIDEYDDPINAAYVHGYFDEALAFLRPFLGAGLKGNPHLFKAVLTGILRVAKESIFSGLNNLAVYSLLRPEFSTCFGFTEAEVTRLLSDAGKGDLLDTVRAWYNGYVFGGQVIYNPWSILNYVASDDRMLRPYWVTTSSNDLIRNQLRQRAFRHQPAIQALLEGGSVERRLDENVSLNELSTREGALFNLLVFSGYLKAEAGEGIDGEEPPYRLSIPNREVRQVYSETFREWMEECLVQQGSDVERLTAALLSGDAEALEEQLTAFTVNLLSYHDLALVNAPGQTTTPLRTEQVVHAFVIGLLATLEPAYLVRSNRESGLGRPDVTVQPRQPGKPGVVLELKVVKPGRSPEQVLSEAALQIQSKAYTAALAAAGATPVHAFAVAFEGKRVWVRTVA
ncbi:AAA family ATPase [Chondromyces apiculatus]|uniref:Weak D-galactarate dehydratase/altronate hydrolase domain protein n=1 Tax=Chondromyces apiculatus DSM 436 TaxID=1192034 RepID=A0A017T2T1_9BACT|nr:AAA family ATPase [Chondromyces apiculatus]EYF03317.1 weak D-galactarate dehydratase/altronate hydrolase domain protein [Chondromyces apiculatus DSM 436]